MKIHDLYNHRAGPAARQYCSWFSPAALPGSRPFPGLFITVLPGRFFRLVFRTPIIPLNIAVSYFVKSSDHPRGNKVKFPAMQGHPLPSTPRTTLTR